MANPNAETLRGTVRRSNGTTILIDERDKPLVVSRYAKNIPSLETGDQVELTLDAREFVTAAVILNVPADPDDQESSARGLMPSRDAKAVRQTCITAAAGFCASRPELKSGDLFSLAEKMETWISREA